MIGACIPTLYPLIQRIFGSYALGSTHSDSSEQQRPPLQTIGSYVTKKRRPGHLSILDTVDDVECEGTEGDLAERQRSENSGETTLRGDIETQGRRESEVEGKDMLGDIEKAEMRESDVEGDSCSR